MIKLGNHLYLFPQCFGTSYSYVQVMSSDFCDGVFAMFKYLNSYYDIFNPVLFIISLESSNFGSRESMFHMKNSQTSKDIEVDISMFLGSSVDVLDKKRYQHNASRSVYLRPLSLTILRDVNIC